LVDLITDQSEGYIKLILKIFGTEPKAGWKPPPRKTYKELTGRLD